MREKEREKKERNIDRNFFFFLKVLQKNFTSTFNDLKKDNSYFRENFSSHFPCNFSFSLVHSLTINRKIFSVFHNRTSSKTAQQQRVKYKCTYSFVLRVPNTYAQGFSSDLLLSCIYTIFSRYMEKGHSAHDEREVVWMISTEWEWV